MAGISCLHSYAHNLLQLGVIVSWSLGLDKEILDRGSDMNGVYNGMLRLGQQANRRLVSVISRAPFFVAVLVFVVCFPWQAYAYSPEGPVVSLTSSVSLVAGEKQTVSCSVNPLSEKQLPGCGMADCPESCGEIVTPSGTSSCKNSEGWCQCGGTTYYTAYTQVNVSSSNPSIARASWRDGSLTIVGHSGGTATITVSASLAKHNGGSASVTVRVSKPSPVPSGNDDSSKNISSSQGGGSNSSSADSKNTEPVVSGPIKVANLKSGIGGARAVVKASDAMNGTEQDVIELEAEDGSKVFVIKATEVASAESELRKIVGTNGSVTFWNGGTLEEPLITWTFYGKDLNYDSELNFNPEVLVYKAAGSGDLAALLAQVNNFIVMDFTHEGILPAPAEVNVLVRDFVDEVKSLHLYCYDETSQEFNLEKEDVVIEDNYAKYTIEHCSIWTLSSDDLTVLGYLGDFPEPAFTSDASPISASQHKLYGKVFCLGIGVLAGIALVTVVVLFLIRRTANEIATNALYGDEPEKLAEEMQKSVLREREKTSAQEMNDEGVV